jgi:UPF0176 protein
MQEESLPIVIAAFYHFVSLPDYEQRQPLLMKFCQEQGLKGTILLAREGINSTISGTREGIDALINYLRSDPKFATLEWKESFAATLPFERLKVRLKKEIVRMGVEDLDIDVRGQYLPPDAWDKVIQQPDVVVVDTRNDYEVKIGKFKNAVDPRTRTFREFPEWVKQNLDPKKTPKVAMYCTGGIRCEKSTALLKQMGFSDVYHLQGGILKYFEETQNKSGLWEGDCFVFDDRVAVTPELKMSGAVRCTECGAPVSTDALRDSKVNELLCEACIKAGSHS